MISWPVTHAVIDGFETLAQTRTACGLWRACESEAASPCAQGHHLPNTWGLAALLPLGGDRASHKQIWPRTSPHRSPHHSPHHRPRCSTSLCRPNQHAGFQGLSMSWDILVLVTGPHARLASEWSETPRKVVCMCHPDVSVRSELFQK